MRKIIVLAALLFTAVCGCKSDPPVYPSFKKVELAGQWSMTSTSRRFYDANDNLLYVQPQSAADVISMSFSGDECTTVYRNGTVVSNYYTLTKLENKSTISFTPPLYLSFNPFDIVTGDPEVDGDLILQAEKSNQSYVENGVTKMADHVIYRIRIKVTN